MVKCSPMVQIAFPALLAVVGVLTYALSTNGKVSELGRIAFFCGLFVLSWVLSATHVRF